nr:hypothetical protein [uncultured Prevotella sp.]
MSEDVQESVGNNKDINVAQTYSLEMTNKEERISQDQDIDVGNSSTQIVGELNILTTNGDLLIKSAKKALMEGKDDARISKG